MGSLSTSQRHLRPFGLIAAFIGRDWASAWSYRFPFISDVLSGFFPLILFFFIGRLVDMGQIEHPELSAGYFSFVVTGAAVIAIFEQGLSSYPSRVASAQRTGTMEAMAASPAPLWLTTFLGSFYDMIHATIASILMVGMAAVLFGIELSIAPAGVPLLLLALASSVLLFSAVGLTAAALTFVFKRAGAFTTGFDFVVAAAAGVWFPLDVLPGPLETIARALPFTWAVETTRAILLEAETPVAEVLYLGACAVIALPLALWLTAASINYARRQGSLSYY